MHPLQKELGGPSGHLELDMCEIGGLAVTRRIPAYIRPVSGNDFHIRSDIDSSYTWETMLQVQTGSEKVSLPLRGTEPQSDMETTAVDTVKRLVEQLCASWLDATIRLLRRTMGVGTVYHPESTRGRFFEWIAYKELNPVSEGVSVNELWISESRLRQILGHGCVSLLPVAFLSEYCTILRQLLAYFKLEVIAMACPESELKPKQENRS